MLKWQYFGCIVLKYTIKLTSTVFFLSALIWLQENVELHMGLTLYISLDTLSCIILKFSSKW
jgi:hypothetical protein